VHQGIPARPYSFLILIFFLSCILGIIYLPEDKKEKKKKDDHHEDGH
jgi:hypothetical protein